MSTFEKREEDFEAKFAHDEEIQFKVRARRDRLFGEWIAAQFGLEGDAAADYAKSIVDVSLDEPGDEDILSKVAADTAKYRPVSREDCLAMLQQCEAEAKQQLMSE